jgi:hypothetical protein
MSEVREFTDVGHCGGKVTVTVVTSAEGVKQYQLKFEHSSPTPASMSMLYAGLDGQPLAFVAMGGIGSTINTPQVPGVSVLLASDMQGMYGHECPRCKEYWRTDGFPVPWSTTCPYCGLRARPHVFLSKGQRKYVAEFCKLVSDAVEGVDGDHVIDLNAVADAAGKDIEKPKFYYAEKQQQHSYECEACGSRQDILGKYGFCSSCGTRNDVLVVNDALELIRERVNRGEGLVSCLKDTITEFDSAARSFAKRLASMVPMKPRRRTELERMLFHNIKQRAEDMLHWFDIDLLKGMSQDEIAFVAKMFARRHVYEHNGGEVDQRYIDDTGDQSVRPKQLIRETSDSVLKTISSVEKMIENFHGQFHEIFPPDPKPISYHRPRLRARQRRGLSSSAS